jgi:hypothetical protein
MLSICALAAAAPAGVHRDIIIVAGQSNARTQYASGVFDAVTASGRFPSPVLFHRSHSGNAMSRWVSGQPGAYTLAENFLSDFWSPDSQADLEALIAGIEAAGDTWDIAGFFWFQGEGDSGSETATARYNGRFMHMLNTLETEFALDHEIPFVLTAIDYNGDDEALARQGRIPEDIEAIRAVQLQLGDSAAIGATHDSRGWPRLDVWHVGDRDDPRGIYSPLADMGAAQAAILLALPEPLSRADLNADGIHDLVDINLFTDWFPASDPRADLAPPADVFDLADINAFTDAFLGR